MTRGRIVIDDDIRRASTLPGWFYTDPAVFAERRERVFVPSWQVAGMAERTVAAGGAPRLDPSMAGE
jgi:hypothetical protein